MIKNIFRAMFKFVITPFALIFFALMYYSERHHIWRLQKNKVFLVWRGFKHHSDNDDLRGVFSTLDKAIAHTLELFKHEESEFKEQNIAELYPEDLDEDFDLEDNNKKHSLVKVWENEEEDQYFIYDVEIDEPI